jgi:hypothetical protein
MSTTASEPTVGSPKDWPIGTAIKHVSYSDGIENVTRGIVIGHTAKRVRIEFLGPEYDGSKRLGHDCTTLATPQVFNGHEYLRTPHASWTDLGWKKA